MIEAQFIVRCVLDDHLYVTGHAAARMVERRLTVDELRQALLSCKIIEHDPRAEPYPSCLVLGWLESGDPLHVKCSRRPGSSVLRIVTLYEPDEGQWEKGFQTRKKR